MMGIVAIYGQPDLLLTGTNIVFACMTVTSLRDLEMGGKLLVATEVASLRDFRSWL